MMLQCGLAFFKWAFIWLFEDVIHTYALQEYLALYIMYISSVRGEIHAQNLGVVMLVSISINPQERSRPTDIANTGQGH